MEIEALELELERRERQKEEILAKLKVLLDKIKCLFQLVISIRKSFKIIVETRIFNFFLFLEKILSSGFCHLSSSDSICFHCQSQRNTFLFLFNCLLYGHVCSICKFSNQPAWSLCIFCVFI